MTLCKFLLFISLLTVLHGQCSMADAERKDCGYVGINQQQCQSKGCCWRPAGSQSNDIPWCFYAVDTTCEKINLDWTGGMGFTEDFYTKMYGLFKANMDIAGKGGVAAANDRETTIGSYFYDWMRDAALTMRTFMEINNFQQSIIQANMRSYVNWVKKTQNQTDPNGFDIRINPKFELPNGQVFMGGWCRPQTDGPALRSAALLLLANSLLQTDKAYVVGQVVPLIKYDLAWIVAKWREQGCDLWQETKSNDLFWNRMSFHYALSLCQQLFSALGDNAMKSSCTTAKNQIRVTLDTHWNGAFMTEASIKQLDSSVIHAFSSFGVYSLTDAKVSKTIKVYMTRFCNEYLINKEDTKKGIPGVLMGRYPGDNYVGGNPWQLLTAVLAKIFYQGATTILTEGFKSSVEHTAWKELLNLSEGASEEDTITAALNAGDAVMYRLYMHVKNDNGHISEQIGKANGLQISAKDLTWSYANILSAMKQREKVVNIMDKIREQTE